APRNHGTEFAVYSHGIAERMPAGHLHYTKYVDDWLLIYFHDPVEAAIDATLLNIPAGAILAWAPGRSRIYGSSTGEWTHSWVQVTGRRVSALLKAASIEPGVPWRAVGTALIEYGIRQLH